jgi:hypothetical protein
MLPEKANRSFWSMLGGKVRRTWLTTFRPRYVAAQAVRRRGNCLQCGRCCRLAFRCPMLTRENRCCIYNLARTRSCKLFPLDLRDVRDVNGKCGYHFSE